MAALAARDRLPVPVIVLDAVDESIGSQTIVDELIVPLVAHAVRRHPRLPSAGRAPGRSASSGSSTRRRPGRGLH